MAASVETAHWLPVPKQVVAVARFHNCAGRSGQVFPQTLGQVLRQVSDLCQSPPRLLRRQAEELIG